MNKINRAITLFLFIDNNSNLNFYYSIIYDFIYVNYNANIKLINVTKKLITVNNKLIMIIR